MKKRYLHLLLSGATILAMSSCGGEKGTEQSESTPDSTAFEEPVIQQSIGFGSEGGSSYAVPSPNELFSIIKEGNLVYKEGLISTADNKYTSSKAQALNFGRLTADIAYTASYEKFQESITNFENLRKIGNDLGISYVFDELMVNRVKSNMDNADSLEVISTNSYQRIISQLEENEKGSTLAIIATGGFVESVYILSHLIDNYSSNPVLIQRLSDQKLVLENVIDYLNLYSDEDRVLEVLDELKPVSDIFLNLKEVNTEAKVNAENEKMIIGGSQINMTEAEFNSLKEAATNYRNNFANASQS